MIVYNDVIIDSQVKCGGRRWIAGAFTSFHLTANLPSRIESHNLDMGTS